MIFIYVASDFYFVSRVLFWILLHGAKDLIFRIDLGQWPPRFAWTKLAGRRRPLNGRMVGSWNQVDLPLSVTTAGNFPILASSPSQISRITCVRLHSGFPGQFRMQSLIYLMLLPFSLCDFLGIFLPSYISDISCVVPHVHGFRHLRLFYFGFFSSF